MRTFIFLALVIFFTISGTWLMINKDDNAPYEIPYLSETEFSFFNLLSDSSSVQNEEWSLTLIGKWRYSFFEYYGETYHKIEGEVEYKEDGTFFSYVTWKYYEGKYRLKDDEPSIIAGGSYSGAWLTENQEWQEKITKCSINTSHHELWDDYDVCDNVYPRGRKIRYGKFNSDKKKSKTVRFDDKKIVIHSKSFHTGLTNKYVFDRITE